MGFKYQNNLVLDIETAGTKPGCVVYEAAFCKVDQKDQGIVIFPVVAASFSYLYQMNSFGFDGDKETIAFWKKHSETWNAIVSECDETECNNNNIKLFFHELVHAITPDTYIWSRGKDFDLPILNHLFHRCGLPMIQPDFRKIVDLRDIGAWEGLSINDYPSKNPHRACSDVQAEAFMLCDLLRIRNERLV